MAENSQLYGLQMFIGNGAVYSTNDGNVALEMEGNVYLYITTEWESGSEGGQSVRSVLGKLSEEADQFDDSWLSISHV